MLSNAFCPQKPVEKSSQKEAKSSRLKEEIAALEGKVAGFKSRLANESYVKNAPESIVQETRDMLLKAEEELIVAKEATGQ